MSEALNKTLLFFGSRSALARALNIHRSNVTLWCKGVKAVPPKHRIAIEQLTDHKIRATEW